MTLKMGQLRHVTNSSTKETDSFTLLTEKTDYSLGYSVSGEDTGQYADVVVKLSADSDGKEQTFDRDTDYYIVFGMAKNLSYAYKFDIILDKADSSESDSYQYIGSWSVAKSDKTGAKSHIVAIYENSAGVVKLAEVTSVTSFTGSGVKIKSGVLYKNAQNVFGLGKSDGTVDIITKVNSVVLLESWENESDTEHFTWYKAIFRPVVDGMREIKLRMTRTTDDYLIKNTITDVSGVKQEIAGRLVNNVNDTKYFRCSLFKLKNLVEKALSGVSTKSRQLSRVGIWSRPGIYMAVNGEQVRVGNSGYYELDVLPITSLGIAATYAEDDWTLDYEYDI